VVLLDAATAEVEQQAELVRDRMARRILGWQLAKPSSQSGPRTFRLVFPGGVLIPASEQTYGTT
jgi:hypothetical protein